MALTKPTSTQALTESGLLLALSLILYFWGFLFPGVGVYLRYLIPGLMAILVSRHGYLYLACFALTLAIGVTLFWGVQELIFTIFMLLPQGAVLPLLYRQNNLKNKAIALLVFTSAAFLVLFFLGQVMGLVGFDLVKELANWNYSVYEKIYTRLGINAEDFWHIVYSSRYFLIPLVGNLYGYMLYLLNKIVYRRGLKIINRVR